MTVDRYIEEEWTKKRLNGYSYFSGWHESIKEIIREVWKVAQQDVVRQTHTKLL